MTNEELKEAIFMALGEASMCWDPLPSNQVFESTRAKEIGDKLVEKIMPILSQCEAMRVMLYDVAEIAKFLNWRSDIGQEKAQTIIDSVHEGKWGGREGIWVQVSKALSHLGEGV